ncbi:hypothetical protein ACIQWA_02575 [Kitasatospora sp. NPDC098652]
MGAVHQQSEGGRIAGAAVRRQLLPDFRVTVRDSRIIYGRTPR